MADQPSISRRRALAAAGIATSGVGGYLAGVRTADAVPDWLAGRDCDPAPLVTDPTDWPFPRHDRAHSSRAPARGAPDWPLDRVWERDWPVRGFFRVARLTVADGVVLAPVSADAESGLFAFSLTDGAEQWRVQTDHGRERGRSRPAIAAGGLAFVSTETPETLAVQARALADGSLRWQRPAREMVTVGQGRILVTDPAAVDPVRVVAYDARTGTRCWAASTDGGDSAAVSDGAALIPRHDSGVTAFDLATGEQRWQSPTGGSRLVVDGERALVSRFAGELRSVALSDRSQEWAVASEHYAADEQNGRGDTVARPDFELGAVAGDAVVYTLDVHSDYPSRVQARDVATGELLWDHGPRPERGPRHGYSRPIAVGDAAVVVEEPEEAPPAVLRLDVATGAERERVTLDAEHVVVPPVVADGRLLVATDQRLIAFA